MILIANKLCIQWANGKFYGEFLTNLLFVGRAWPT